MCDRCGNVRTVVGSTTRYEVGKRLPAEWAVSDTGPLTGENDE